MESIEFLGGRYNRPEQIMSGPVQAFRAQSAASGKTVFIHRVSTTESPEEQAGLLKLLTRALVKSADAKQLVLDFGEESGYWYVVTESAPQCALLREWLQLEIDALSGAPLSSAAKNPSPVATPPSESAPIADPGEFTRFLQARPSSSTISASSAPAKTKLPEPKPSVGEFTRFFRPGDSQAGNSIPQDMAFKDVDSNQTDSSNTLSTDTAAIPLPAAPQRPVSPPSFVPPPVTAPTAAEEPGEFTRFFTPGLPAVPPKPSQSSLADRTFNNPHVQRPSTPVRPVVDQKETGEFTRMFSRSPQVAQAPAVPQAKPFQPQPLKRSDPLGFSSQEMNPSAGPTDDLFSDRIDVGKPLQPTQKPEGEFTKIFGSMGAEAPPMPGPSVVAASNAKPLLDERGLKNDPYPQMAKLPPIEPQQTAYPSSENGPSEFTVMMQGNGPAAGVTKPVSPPKPGVSQPPLNFQALPIALPAKPVLNASAIPHVPPLLKMPPPNVPLPAFASPPVKGDANRKLTIFFALLAILTIALIVVILFVMKNK